MDTYLLTGNPDRRENGMNREAYQESYRKAQLQQSPEGVEDDWTFGDFQSKDGDQVVLLRTGKDKAGLIGFGRRRKGAWALVKGRRQYPVSFYNLRSLDDEPYISRERLGSRGFQNGAHFPMSGVKLNEKLLSALEACCNEELLVSLSTLCGAPHVLAPSFTKGSDISCDSPPSGPTTGPVPSSWTATVNHSVNAPTWTYAFRFGDRQLWKIGQACDLEGRLSEVRRHVPEEVLSEQWRLAFRHRWTSAAPAYDREQRILRLLAEQRTMFERIKCSERELETAWAAALADVLANRGTSYVASDASIGL